MHCAPKPGAPARRTLLRRSRRGNSGSSNPDRSIRELVEHNARERSGRLGQLLAGARHGFARSPRRVDDEDHHLNGTHEQERVAHRVYRRRVYDHAIILQRRLANHLGETRPPEKFRRMFRTRSGRQHKELGFAGWPNRFAERRLIQEDIREADVGLGVEEEPIKRREPHIGIDQESAANPAAQERWRNWPRRSSCLHPAARW